MWDIPEPKTMTVRSRTSMRVKTMATGLAALALMAVLAACQPQTSNVPAATFEAAKAEAAQRGVPILLDFYIDQ